MGKTVLILSAAWIDMDRYGHEMILVMLETPSVYLCCTGNRGVIRGGPILTGKHDTDVTDFETE